MDSHQRAKELYVILHAYLDRAGLVYKSAKVEKEKGEGYSLIRGQKNSDEMRPKSQPYISQWSVRTLCLGHGCGRTIRNLIIDISGMIRNVSGDLKSLVSVS